MTADAKGIDWNDRLLDFQGQMLNVICICKAMLDDPLPAPLRNRIRRDEEIAAEYWCRAEIGLNLEHDRAAEFVLQTLKRRCRIWRARGGLHWVPDHARKHCRV